ncbi:MAG: HPr(Ser) kinase/phosphatase [Candidatus Improbicoccus devescovinae]|nr:MAG: HPr(Ser) kinase/phosphatase [Candidatus Improbicoccus devescovinae]
MSYVELSKIISHLCLKKVFVPNESYKNLLIKSRHINRMGLDLIGALQEFNSRRILIMGESENLFLSNLNSEEIKKSIGTLFSLKPPVLFVTRNIQVSHEIIEMAQSYEIPIFMTEDKTSDFIIDLTEYLAEFLAPKISRSGGLISIHGDGVLIIGESGIGKSETALDLISRGHKFVSDDITEIKKISAHTLFGSAPENVSEFIEVRGVGIVNIRNLFGIDAIKKSETIDLVVSLEHWAENQRYSELGNEEKYVEILEVQVPFVSIPVKSGKNLSVIIEVAALNNKIKKFGGDPYSDLMKKLTKIDTVSEKIYTKVNCIWDIDDKLEKITTTQKI